MDKKIITTAAPGNMPPNAGAVSPNVGRVPPQAPEMERATLGEMIIDAKCVETAISLLEADMFYRDENRLVFAAIAELYSDNKAIDLMTVVQCMKKNGTLEQAGGMVYVSHLCQAVGSGAHIEYHCKIVLQMYLMRRLAEAGSEILKTGFESSLDVSDALEKSGKLLAEISDVAEGRRSVRSFAEIADTSLDELYRRMDTAKNGRMTGITTGLAELDAKLFGWVRSNLIILAGRPGQGKSALMLHFALSAARAGVPVVIFSLEMSAVSLMDRLTLSMCDVSAHKFRNGFVSRDELCGIESAVEQLKMLPITIDDTATVSMSQIKSKARALSRVGRCGMVFIDYLQLIKMDVGYGRNVNNAVSEVSREAKILAKEIDVPVMLLSQLNREVEHRASKRPQLSDLRDSGSIEQDADIVVFVFRPAYYKIEVPELSEKNSGILTVSKFREGAVGDVFFGHNESLTQIFDYGLQATATTEVETAVAVQGEIPF